MFQIPSLTACKERLRNLVNVKPYPLAKILFRVLTSPIFGRLLCEVGRAHKKKLRVRKCPKACGWLTQPGGHMQKKRGLARQGWGCGDLTQRR